MKANLVFGPESSGNRLMRRILVAAGCHGSDDYEQPWDAEQPTVDPIVWGRSVPHGKDDFEAGLMEPVIRKLWDWNYDAIQVAVMTREWYALCASQVKHEHVPSFVEAAEHVRLAYQQIFADLARLRLDYLIVSYDALTCVGKPVLEPIMDWFGLPMPSATADGIVLTDENAKYYTTRKSA